MAESPIVPARSGADAAARWLIRLLLLAAAGVAGYLLYVSLSSRGLPVGCGAGSACEEVLTSRWSAIFGVPVSGPALVLYLAAILASLFIGPRQPPSRRRDAWGMLLLFSSAIAVAAVWFIILQLFVIRAICPWCMGGHVLGLIVAGLVFWRALLGNKAPQADATVVATPAHAGNATIEPSAAAGLALVGFILVAGLAVGQWALPYQPRIVRRLPPGKNDDTGPGPQRRISVATGELEIAPHEEPMLGSADAPKLVVIIFDYCCPHCRDTHRYLVHGLDRYPNQFGIVLLPMPLDADCNPAIKKTEERFDHACDLARLALAVFRTKPEAFREFDLWLFEPEMPRHRQDAKKKAEDLIGAAALEEALKDPWIDERIQRHVKIYDVSKASVIPVIMSPTIPSIVGRPSSEQELFDVLEKELGLKPALK